MFIIKAIVKLVFKLILFPVQLLLYFVSFLAQVILSLSGVVVVPLFLVILTGGILAAVEHLWPSSVVALVMMGVIFLFYFGSGIILGIVEFLADSIGEFIVS
jgi:hypothetical protein